MNSPNGTIPQPPGRESPPQYEWRARVGDDVLGPMSIEDLRQRVRDGSIPFHAETWQEGGQVRATAGEILEAYTRAREAYQSSEFLQRIHHLVPSARFTNLLTGACCLWFFVTFINGVSPISPTVADLVRWGGMSAQHIIEGQTWRLLSGAFVHVGIIHLFFNMWCLRNLGQIVERMFGGAAFLFIYLVAALGGNLCGLWWHPLIVSAGASGAVFGLIGAMLGFILVRRGEIKAGIFSRLLKSGLTFVGYNVIFGLMVPNIDNAAHLGGLATGFLAGACLSRPLFADPPRRPPWQYGLALLLCAAIVAASAARIVSLRSPASVAMAPLRIHEYSVDLHSVAQHSEQKWQQAEATHRNGFMTGAEAAALILREIVPDWQNLRRDYAPLAAVRSKKGCPADLAKELGILDEYVETQLALWDATARYYLKPDEQLSTERDALLQRLARLVRRWERIQRDRLQQRP